MKAFSYNPPWSVIAPLFGAALMAADLMGSFSGSYFIAILGLGVLASVLASVHHAEVVAHRLGEPFGTMLLAIAITIIEVGLIVSMMLAGDHGAGMSELARDTVYAAVMLILNGIIGLCLLVGGKMHHEQTYGKYGVSASLATLATIAVLTLVLPNYTTSSPGPSYTDSQLAFIATAAFVLYLTFALVQTVRHRDYFAADSDEEHAEIPGNSAAISSGVLLVISLVAVVMLGHALAPSIENAVDRMGAPKSLVGIIIAAMVLMPEGLSAVRAARANRIQTSLNLAIGSALASIGLTIPTVALVALWTGWPLSLGIDAKSTVLLMLSLLVTTNSLGTGRTTVLQGVVHLVICATYLLMTIVP